MDMKGKIAIVTGGIRGIGRGVTEDFINQGVSVLAAYFEGPDEAGPAVDSLNDMARKKGVGFASLHCDLSKLPDIIRLFNFCEEKLGKADYFIANAGANLPRKPILEHSEADFDLVCGINFRGTFFCVKACGERLNDNGRIVVISSSSVSYPVDGHGVYTPTKAAVEMIAKLAAMEFGPRGITVNAVEPGVTMTHMAKAVLSPEFIEQVREGTPLKRVGECADVARAVTLLCRPEAEWISGQVVIANGGSQF